MVLGVCTPGFGGLATSFPRFARLAFQVRQRAFRGLHAWLSRCDNVLSEICTPGFPGVTTCFPRFALLFARLVFHRIGRTARVAATPRRSRGRAWRRCRAGPSDNAAGMLSADNQMHALPPQSHKSRVGGHALRTSTTTPGSRWKAVVPSTSAYGHGPRPSPCLLSRSRPCLLVAFTTHRTSAVARGPDPRRTAAATNAKHDRRLTV